MKARTIPSGKEFADHGKVDHSREEYAYLDRATKTVITINAAEGFFSIFKRGMIGIYQHCSEQHLHRYLAEFDFRYSHRIKLGIDDGARADRACSASKASGLPMKRLEAVKVRIDGIGRNSERAKRINLTHNRVAGCSLRYCSA